MKNILYVVLALISIQINAQETLLRFNLVEGNEYKFSFKSSSEMGAMMAQSVETEGTLKVVSVSDTTIVNEIRITRMASNMVQGQNIIEFDSSKSDEELDENGKMMKSQLAPLLKTVITTVQNKRGKLVSVYSDPKSFQAEQMNVQGSMSIPFPEEPVKVGSSWSDTKETGGMTMTSTYTVESISKDFVTLLFSGTITGAAKGGISGKMKVDKVTGLPKESTTKMNMEIQGMQTSMIIDTEIIGK